MSPQTIKPNLILLLGSTPELATLERHLGRCFTVELYQEVEQALGALRPGGASPTLIIGTNAEELQRFQQKFPETLAVAIGALSEGSQPGLLQTSLLQEHPEQFADELIALFLEHHSLLQENRRMNGHLEMVEMLNEHLISLQKQSRYDLEQARVAQELLLPHSLDVSTCLQIQTEFIPMDEVGGDFYDVLRLNDHLIGMVVADVTGHGLSASMIAMMLRLTFRQVGGGLSSTQEAISRINDTLNDYMPPGRFASLFYMIFDEQSQELTYTCAGHPPAYLIRQGTEEITSLSTDGVVLGVLPSDLVQYGEGKVQLNPGDRVLIYTDALLETNPAWGKSRSSELFGEPRLRKTLSSLREENLSNMTQKIMQSVLNFAGKDRFDDDATLMGIEVHATQEERVS